MTPTQELVSRGPHNIPWTYGVIPAVEDVPYDCTLFFWSPEYIGYLQPWGDKLNALRWNTWGGIMLRADERLTGWWTTLNPGTAELKRPDYVRTKAEFDVEQAFWVASLSAEDRAVYDRAAESMKRQEKQ